MGPLERWGEVHRCDVLVIGGGLAGAFAAIKARENGAERVLLVDKAMTGKSGCSTFAAGVTSTFIPEEDDFDAWFTEMVNQGSYLNDQEWLKVLLIEKFDLVKEMEQWGVIFEKTPDGKFERKAMRGGGGTSPMKSLMFHGPQMMEAMRARALAVGVKVMDRVMVVDLLTRDGNVVGAVGFDSRSGDFKLFLSPATVIATGGTAYKSLFANHKMCTGDGYGMIYRAGGILSGFDFCEHHASAAAFDILGMNMFVALGGTFVNAQGERFLLHYDPDLGDRTLQFRYSQAMALETMAGRGPIYMDMTHFRPEDVAKLRAVLPLITKNLEAAGVLSGDRVAKKMEYVSTNQGTIGKGGGARINIKCETSLPGLYAVGDAADRRSGGAGAHGGGALSFAMVSGARAGQYAANWAKEMDEPKADDAQAADLKERILAPLRRREGVEPDQVVLALQEAVTGARVFIISHEKRLKEALAEVQDIAKNQLPFLIAYDPHYLRMAHEAINMTLTAQLWLSSALMRQESRGSLLREDFPEVNNLDWLKWITIILDRGEMKLTAEEIPFERYPLKSKRERYLHPTWQAAMRRDGKVGNIA